MTTFICYAREDRAVARRLADELRAAGIDIWIDEHIGAGKAWDAEVETALEKSNALLVILSPDAVQSQAVMNEVGYALDEGKNVVPVLYRACKVPLRLRRLQYLELDSYDDAISRIVSALKGTPIPPPLREKSRWPVVGAFAAFGAILGAWSSYAANREIDRFMIVAALLGAAILAIAGAICGRRRGVIIAAVVGAVVMTVAFRLADNDAVDSLGSGFTLGPLVGAIAGRIWIRFKRR